MTQLDSFVHLKPATNQPWSGCGIVRGVYGPRPEGGPDHDGIGPTKPSTSDTSRSFGNSENGHRAR